MPSTTASEILDNITTSCAAGHADVFPIPVAPAGTLPRYDAACVAVAMARTVDEVQEIAANAEALRAYARQAKNRQLELDAAEIRIRAERRLGELMAAQGETVGKAKGGAEKGVGRRGNNAGSDKTRIAPSLAEAGIDKNLAHRARTLAAVPKEKFVDLLDEKRRREDRRVVLDPYPQAETDVAAEFALEHYMENPPDPRLAIGGIDGVLAQIGPLRALVEALKRRMAALLRKNRALEERARLWKERAEGAGWTESADACAAGNGLPFPERIVT